MRELVEKEPSVQFRHVNFRMAIRPLRGDFKKADVNV